MAGKVTDSLNLLSELVKLPHQVAVITGGNRGIGVFVVEKLLKCEMTVVMGKNTFRYYLDCLLAKSIPVTLHGKK